MLVGLSPRLRAVCCCIPLFLIAFLLMPAAFGQETTAGFTGMVKDDQIQHVLMTEKDLDRAVERLITAANEEGGVDNISCVLARVEAA